MRKYRNRLRRMKQFWSIRYFIRIPGGAWEVKKDLLHSCSRSQLVEKAGYASSIRRVWVM